MIIEKKFRIHLSSDAAFRQKSRYDFITIMLIDSWMRGRRRRYPPIIIPLPPAHLRHTISVIDGDDDLLLFESIKLSRYPLHLLVEPSKTPTMNSQFHSLLFISILSYRISYINIFLIFSQKRLAETFRRKRFSASRGQKHLSILIDSPQKWSDIKIYLMECPGNLIPSHCLSRPDCAESCPLSAHAASTLFSSRI